MSSAPDEVFESSELYVIHFNLSKAFYVVDRNIKLAKLSDDGVLWSPREMLKYYLFGEVKILHENKRGQLSP